MQNTKTSNYNIPKVHERMPSKSRKKMKGQARKAKAAATNNTTNVSEQRVGINRRVRTIQDIKCYHGQVERTPDICAQFIKSFFDSYIDNSVKPCVSVVAVNDALDVSCSLFPEVVMNKNYLDIVKKNIVSNGANFLLIGQSYPPSHSMAIGCAVALMVIDTYTPSSPIPDGIIDQRDAKSWLRNLDITNGCQRSLVKIFANRTPCNCV